MTHGFCSRKDKLAMQAYTSWHKQIGRCTKPGFQGYANYGARGIRVEYSLAEFIAWWKCEHAKRASWKRPTCGRIDHDGNYSFDNIVMQECVENILEMVNRTRFKPKKKHVRKVMMLDSKGNDAILFPSIRIAQDYLGISNVGRICQGKRQQEHGFRFRYFEKGELLPS